MSSGPRGREWPAARRRRPLPDGRNGDHCLRRSALAEDDGVVTLEFGLALPLLALLLVVVVHLIAFIHQGLVVHEAARAAARVAITTRDDRQVSEAAAAAADGRPVDVRVTPPNRQPGDLVTVVVRLGASAGPVDYTVEGRAVGQVEPGT